MILFGGDGYATLYKQDAQGGKPSVVVAKKIIYIRSTGETFASQVQSVSGDTNAKTTPASSPATRTGDDAGDNASEMTLSAHGEKRSLLVFLGSRFQLLDLDLAELDHRAGVVLLQGEVAGLEAIFRVGPLDRLLAVDQDGDLRPLADHFLGEPLVGLVQPPRGYAVPSALSGPAGDNPDRDCPS